VAALLGAAFVLWLVLFAPQLLVPAATQISLRDVPDAAKQHELQDGRLKLQNDVRTTLLQGLGGLAVLVGAFFTYRQVQTNRRQLDHTIESSRQQHELDRQGQITERFTRAIDQLGHAQLDVRLGGIYALERIARDSPDDQPMIGEVLTAFVRSHAPWPPRLPGQYLATAPINAVPELQVRAPDVQACVTVLGRGDFSSLGDPLDLHKVDLRRANLRNAHLERTRLYCAHLERADLVGAHLEGAHLFDAHLEGAHLSGAHLEEANLDEAHLAIASLGLVHLEEASLNHAHLERAYLGGAHLERAYLNESNLEGAHLHNAYLETANLHEANLKEANLIGARLKGALADEDTAWPAGFDWRAAGVIIAEDEDDAAN
jgi:hypothetical protein